MSEPLETVEDPLATAQESLADATPERYRDRLLRKAYELAENKIGAFDFLEAVDDSLAAVENAVSDRVSKKLAALARRWRHARSYGQRTPDSCADELTTFVATGELPTD